MQNHNLITPSPETLLFLAHVDANRRPTGGVTPTKPLLTAWTIANEAAGVVLNLSGKAKPAQHH
jgi:hypothetical protein